MSSVNQGPSWSIRAALLIEASVLLTGATTILYATPATAAWTQATCATTGVFQPSRINTQLGANSFPKAANNSGAYALNTVSTWNVYMNGNIANIRPWYSADFDTENYWDYIELGALDGTHRFTGPHIGGGSTGLSIPPFTYSYNWYTRFSMKWNSDWSYNRVATPSLNQIEYACKANQTAVAANALAIPSNTRVDGILIGTGDTIYFQVYQPSGTTMILTVDQLDGDPNLDFDLYADPTNASPDWSAAWKSEFGWTSRGEAIKVNAPASSRTIYVGVHSYHGAGHFVFHAHQLNSNISMTFAPVLFTLSATDKTALTNFLKMGALRLFQATNGSIFVSSFSQTTWPLGNILLLNNGGAKSSASVTDGPPCGQAQYDTLNWQGIDNGGPGTIFAHEEGHACFGMHDEYVGDPAGENSLAVCGHGLMNNHLSNFKIYCSIAHCSDGTWNDSLCNTHQPGWYTLEHSWWGTFNGPQFYDIGETADSTDYTGNLALKALISVTYN